MKTKIFKSIYAMVPNSQEIIDEFTSVKELKSSMKCRGRVNYDIVHYCQALIDDTPLAEAIGETAAEARKNLECKLLMEYKTDYETIKKNPNVLLKNRIYK